MVEYFAHELANIPEASLEIPCRGNARHCLRQLADSLWKAGSGGIPTDSAVRAVIRQFETETGKSDQPLPKPRGKPLLPSDKVTSKTPQAELGKLRRELSHSRSSKSAPKNQGTVKAAASSVDVAPGLTPFPV